jgi:hypothetical protein
VTAGVTLSPAILRCAVLAFGVCGSSADVDAVGVWLLGRVWVLSAFPLSSSTSCAALFVRGGGVFLLAHPTRLLCPCSITSCALESCAGFRFWSTARETWRHLHPCKRLPLQPAPSTPSPSSILECTACCEHAPLSLCSVCPSATCSLRPFDGRIVFLPFTVVCSRSATKGKPAPLRQRRLMGACGHSGWVVWRHDQHSALIIMPAPPLSPSPTSSPLRWCELACVLQPALVSTPIVCIAPSARGP